MHRWTKVLASWIQEWISQYLSIRSQIVSLPEPGQPGGGSRLGHLSNEAKYHGEHDAQAENEHPP